MISIAHHSNQKIEQKYMHEYQKKSENKLHEIKVIHVIHLGQLKKKNLALKK